MAIDQSTLETLRSIVSASNVLTAKEDLIPYAFDGTAVIKETPGCVVFVKTTEDVSQVLRLANDTDTPVVTRGSGTGLSGGSIPVADCIVLCMVKMERILELDAANLTMTVEPGVTTIQIAEAAERADLFYPPDPGSMKISTIGGNVAENSGGLRGQKYGVTRNYVMGMEVVLPDGEVMWLGNKCVKDVAGFSLKDVMIGSEGALGVITKVLLKLIPKPAAKKTMVSTFNAMDAAALKRLAMKKGLFRPLGILLHPAAPARRAPRCWRNSSATQTPCCSVWTAFGRAWMCRAKLSVM